MPTEPPSNERRLLTAFRNGDRSAFDSLFHQYAGRLLAFALRINGGCRADAEDLVQETFVAAFRSAGNFRGGSRLLTYLFSILVRRHRDRGRRLQLPVLAYTEEHDTAYRASSLEDNVIHHATLRDALATLDAPLREAFLLVAAQGMTHKEAAGVLNAPVGTIKWRVAEAAKRLRVALMESEKDHEPEQVSAKLSNG